MSDNTTAAQPPNKPPYGDALALARNLTVFIAAALYFLGFVYQYYFFNTLGISMGQLDIPVYYFFIYSYNVVYTWWWWFAILAAVGSTGFGLYQKLYDRFRSWHLLIAGLATLLVVFLFFTLARDTGEKLATQVRSGQYVRPVQFVFKAGAAESLSQDLQCANKAGDLRLLTQTSTSYFVLDQNIPPKSAELPTGYMYEIPASEVKLVKVELQNTRKQ